MNLPQTNRLSKREKEVVDLLLQGKSNKQIALSLSISESTVEFHLKNVYAKLKVSSRGELFRLFSELGKPTGSARAEELGESTGGAGAEKLGESTVDRAGENADNGGKPILQRHETSTLALKIRPQEISKFLGAHKTLVSITILLAVVLVFMLSDPFGEYQRECENPDDYTVGQTLQRSNASGTQVHGQFGTIPAPPWQPKSGYVTYKIIKVSLVTHWYLRLRYSKYSPSSVSILIFLDNEPVQRATLFPLDQGSWNQFVWTEPIDLGNVWIGTHSIKFYTDGQEFGVADLDRFVLTTEPPSVVPAPTPMTP